MLATTRIPVLMSPVEKMKIVARAKKAGMKTSEFMRLAAREYNPHEDEKALLAMINEMNKATENAAKSIDEALSFVAASNKRIRKMELNLKKSAES